MKLNGPLWGLAQSNGDHPAAPGAPNVEGPLMPRRSRRRNILFVGRRNDARTQMAEGFANALLEPLTVTVRSAGITPTRVSPWAVRVMAEVGIDITGQVSKALDTVVASNIDTLILVERGLTIPPRFHLVRRVEWQVDAPNAIPLSSDAMLRNFRKARDDIEACVLALIASRAASASRAKP